MKPTAKKGPPPARRKQAPADEPSEYETYYEIIRHIPRGRVMTYGDVAHSAGRPLFARRVGYALAALKDPGVPWWRVINARGQISPRGWGGESADQRDRLALEGMVFDDEGRVNLKVYRGPFPIKTKPKRRPR